ncbi:MAG: ABC transporter permease [Proteobacteria bacterium]|nr:ABC transporter permease [Pseudomonadota bacterium]MBI3495904.1 ABC transporter permease [Pseudomonadota bacterium]
MIRYIIQRLVSSVPVVVLVTLISFSIMQLVPGDPAAVMAGPSATKTELDQMRHQLGLDQPFALQLAGWYGGLLRGDLGRSILLGRSVAQAIAERVPVTLALALFSFALTLALGIPIGMIAAMRQNTWIDQAAMTLALLGVSLPNFWLGLMLIALFSVSLDLLPAGGYVPISLDPVGWFKSLILPSLSLALLQVGLLARITRSTMLEVLRQDYIRTAKAKGLPERVVIGKHATKNVLVPVTTVIGITFSLLLSGSVVIETVYSLPGLGRLIATSIFSRDYPVIQGGLLVTAVMFVFLNLVVDVLYAWLDPRVRYD